MKLNIQLFGGRGANSSLEKDAKTLNLSISQIYENARNGGITPREYIDMIKYQRSRMSQNREQREITSSTYKRAQNRLQRNVDSWFGIGR